MTNWWGKVVCGALGFVAGGPIGAVVGAVFGHQFDRGLGQQAKVRSRPQQYGSAGGVNARKVFLDATFSVMGHLAKVDGRVSENEIRAARAVMYQMNLSPAQIQQAIRRFTEGKRTDFPLDSVLSDLKKESRQRQDLCRAFVEIQMKAVLADGQIRAAERDMLWHICGELGISRVEMAQIEALVRAQRVRHERARTQPARKKENPLGESYGVLGVPTSASDAEVKTAYRRLMNQHHPDKLIAKGLPEEMMKDAKEKTREIRAAYDAVKKARGM